MDCQKINVGVRLELLTSILTKTITRHVMPLKHVHILML